MSSGQAITIVVLVMRVLIVAALIASATLLVIALTYFFRQNVWAAFNELRGRNIQRQISQMREARRGAWAQVLDETTQRIDVGENDERPSLFARLSNKLGLKKAAPDKDEAPEHPESPESPESPEAPQGLTLVKGATAALSVESEGDTGDISEQTTGDLV